MANITLNENPQLNLEMEAMTVNTEGHCDEWNRRHKQLLENDHYLSEEQKKNNEPEFTVAEKRENIASKEKMPKILGKIAKFFTDLKTVAFSGKYSDLDGKPAIVNNNTATEAGSALDARQANPTIEGTMANQISQLNSDLSDLSGSLNNIVFKDVSDKLDTDHVTGKMSAVNIGKIVMVYFDIIPKAVSDNTTILPTGTIPNAYVYAYHSMNTWGQSAIPDSLMAVRDDGSLAFWSGKDSIGTRIFDSFIYLSR